MSTSTFESNIKQIPHKQESVFNTLSDLNNLQRLKDKFEQVKDQIPADKREAVCGENSPETVRAAETAC